MHLSEICESGLDDWELDLIPSYHKGGVRVITQTLAKAACYQYNDKSVGDVSTRSSVMIMVED